MKIIIISIFLLLSISLQNVMAADSKNQESLQPMINGSLTPQQPQSMPTNIPGQPDAAEEDIRDIKGVVQLAEPIPISNYLYWTMAALLILALSFILWKKLQKKPVIPLAHETAFKELTDLSLLKTSAKALIYADRLSAILRRYLEARFALQSTRWTTREFFHCLINDSRSSIFTSEQHDKKLQQCLEQCDLAKFAHCPPTIAQMDEMEQEVREFITITRDKIEKEATQ